MTGWKRGLLVGVLALSLLGNALTVGALVRISHLRTALMGDSATASLPKEERRALGRALAAHAGDLKPGVQAVQTARAAAVQAIGAKPYDAVKAAAALDSLRGAVDLLMSQSQGVVLQDLARRAAD